MISSRLFFTRKPCYIIFLFLIREKVPYEYKLWYNIIYKTTILVSQNNKGPYGYEGDNIETIRRRRIYMHEMSIAEGIVDIALQIADQHQSPKVNTIFLELGRMSGVEPDALQFCFEAVTRGTKAEGAKLEIDFLEIVGQCIECKHEFPVENYVFKCPNCESTIIDTISGRELRVTSVDLEEV